MDMDKTCCFTGHRPKSLGFGEDSEKGTELKERLKEHIIDLIEREGVTHFISGVALGVDTYAAEIVLELKRVYPQITLEAAIPCESQSDKWKAKDRERYAAILERCDTVTMIQTEYTKDCMHKRNRYMVDHSAYVLAVWNGKPSGTGKTVEYAIKKGIAVIRV